MPDKLEELFSDKPRRKKQSLRLVVGEPEFGDDRLVVGEPEFGDRRLTVGEPEMGPRLRVEVGRPEMPSRTRKIRDLAKRLRKERDPQARLDIQRALRTLRGA